MARLRDIQYSPKLAFGKGKGAFREAPSLHHLGFSLVPQRIELRNDNERR